MLGFDKLQGAVGPLASIVLVAMTPVLIVSVANPSTPWVTKSETPEMKRTRVWADLSRIHSALGSFAAERDGTAPSRLFLLLGRGGDGEFYIQSQRDLTDPWYREYVYVRESMNVLTYGRDGVPGGTGEDADIDYASVLAGR